MIRHGGKLVPLVAVLLVASTSRAGTCQKDLDCPGDEICDSQRRCVKPGAPAAPSARPGRCSTDMDCQGQDVCEGGQCVAPRPAAPPPPPPGAISVGSIPPGATLVLDGSTVGKTPTRVQVPPGPHKLELTLEGHVPEHKEIVLEAGASAEWSPTLRLTPEEEERRAVEAERAAQLKQRQAEAEARYQKELEVWERESAPKRAVRKRDTYLGGVGVGLGAALVAGSAAPFVLGGIKGGKAHDKYSANTNPALFATHRKDIESARKLLLVGTVLAGSGVVVLGVGSFFLAHRPEVSPAPTLQPIVADLKVSLAPLPGGGGCLAATGHF